jgi:hypothetical protein
VDGYVDIEKDTVSQLFIQTVNVVQIYHKKHAILGRTHQASFPFAHTSSPTNFGLIMFR